MLVCLSVIQQLEILDKPTSSNGTVPKAVHFVIRAKLQNPLSLAFSLHPVHAWEFSVNNSILAVKHLFSGMGPYDLDCTRIVDR